MVIITVRLELQLCLYISFHSDYLMLTNYTEAEEVKVRESERRFLVIYYFTQFDLYIINTPLTNFICPRNIIICYQPNIFNVLNINLKLLHDTKNEQ